MGVVIARTCLFPRYHRHSSYTSLRVWSLASALQFRGGTQTVRSRATAGVEQALPGQLAMVGHLRRRSPQECKYPRIYRSKAPVRKWNTGSREAEPLRRSIQLHAIASAPASSATPAASASTATSTTTSPLIVDQVDLFKFFDLRWLRDGPARYTVRIHFPEKEIMSAQPLGTSTYI